MLCFVLTSGSVAYAQMPDYLKIANAVSASASAADRVSTYYGVKAGGREGNPLIAWVGPENATATAGLGLAIDVGLQVLLNKLLGKSHPKALAGALFASAGFRTWATWHNRKVTR